MDALPALKNFDGKNTAPLEALARKLPRDDAEFAQLAANLENDDAMIRVAASWVLKRWSDDGVAPPEALLPDFARRLDRATRWEVRLHLLQMFAAIPIPTQLAAKLSKTATRLTDDENKFVRAWALGALANLADQHPRRRPDVTARLQEASKDSPASVRARIRQIVKQYRWASAT